MIARKVVLGVIVIIVAYLYRRYKLEQEAALLDNIEQSVLNAWNVTISPPTRRFHRVSVGINCNLDLIVSGIELMEGLGLNPGENLDSVKISSLGELQDTFTHYFTKGSAAERGFTDSDTYSRIIETAKMLKSKQFYIGGNAALMAAKIASLFDGIAELDVCSIHIHQDGLYVINNGFQIQLVGPIGPLLKELMPGTVSIPKQSIISQDEVHLIMEYSVNEKWGDITTPVANRFITSYDESNSKLTMLDTFFKSLKTFSPDVVLLSGLHMLDAESTGFIDEKLESVRRGLGDIEPHIPVHLELASMANSDCVKQILNKVVTQVVSLGLNEQELSFLSHVAGGPHASDFLHHKGQPLIYKIGDMIHWLLKNYGYSKDRKTSRLTRVHFHSLTYHMVGVVPGAWDNIHSAVAAGTSMAGQQACDVGVVTPEHVEIRIPETYHFYSGDHVRTLDPENPVTDWKYDGFQFVFSPVLVCKQPLKTVGLGDAISSTGLMFSQYNPDFFNV